ncbi:MAG: ProQ/FinO family protein [Methylomonas sp.]
MGFEQLASLRDELAKQAAAEKSLKHQKKTRDEASAKKAIKVDPLVPIIGLLQKTFPVAFPKKPAPKVPLKIGIHNDIFERADQLGIDKQDLRKAIKAWCWGNRYWECLVEDAARLDLDGNAAGQVTKADADRAKKLQAGRRKKTESVASTPKENVEPKQA